MSQGQQDAGQLGREEGQGVTGERSRRNKNQGVNMDGKVRETTVTTQPLRQGKGSATTRRTEAGKGREDKTRNTSEPAYGQGLTGKFRKTTASGGALSRRLKTRTRDGSVDGDRLRDLKYRYGSELTC
ncbi:hypothetical protein CF327_g3744 [Tilletia walkeri]|nr:hypothetical protein CF327_g3744 [Tilletia walkeri]